MALMCMRQEAMGQALHHTQVRVRFKLDTPAGGTNEHHTTAMRQVKFKPLSGGGHLMQLKLGRTGSPIGHS